MEGWLTPTKFYKLHKQLRTELVNHRHVIHYLYYDNVKHLKNQRAYANIFAFQNDQEIMILHICDVIGIYDASAPLNRSMI